MSSYRHIYEIVSRTKSLLSNNEDTEYETTLLLNCCLGLLIIPQQETSRTKPVFLRQRVSYDEWGIDPNQNKGAEATYDIGEVTRHFRNSLAHNRFDIIDCNPGPSINNIRIRDYYDEDDVKQGKPNFDLTLSISDFKRFVLKYATEIENILKNL